MILDTKLFKTCCASILNAIDNSELSTLNETLELKTEENNLFLNVTNGEYYVRVKFALEHAEEFHATVNANTFLKLIAACTTATIELTIQNNILKVKANGNYKLPLIFENENLLALTPITIANKTVEMNIGGDILNSILQYNGKYLSKTSMASPIQRLYCIDQEGCASFTIGNGACINSFTLEKPIKILINNKLVKLFKLFKNDLVTFNLGYDPVNETIIQTKVSFKTTSIELTAIISSDDTLLNRFPIAQFRTLANKTYPYSTVVNKNLLLQAINRLALFMKDCEVGFIKSSAEGLTITTENGENEELIAIENNTITEEYSICINLINVKTLLEDCSEQYVTLNYGEGNDRGKAVVMTYGAIKNVIPEMRIN